MIRRGEKMRILMIDVDTLRPDHLGCYGYGRNTSPNIDAIASEGVRFLGNYCADAPCLPSRAGLVTGKFGIRTGVVSHGGVCADMRSDGPSRGMQDENQRHNLPAVLGRAGIYPVSFSSFPERHGAWWFNAGFRECYNFGKRGLEVADEVSSKAIHWLKDNEDREDWFMHVHFWDPHIPIRVPEEIKSPFENQPLADTWMNQDIIDYQRKHEVGPHTAMEVDGYLSTTNPATPMQIGEVRDMADYKKMIDGYDTGIWYADYHIGLILSELERQGLLEDTAIIVTSDHGEHLGEKGSYQEHGEASHVVTHVPMVIKWPGGAKDVVSNGLHYNVDLLPTLIDLIGGAPEIRMHRVCGIIKPSDYDGISYADQILKGTDGGRDYLVVSQCAHVCQRSVIFDDWIYTRTYHDGYRLYEDEALYNLKSDSNEQFNVAKENDELCWKGAYLLEKWVSDNMKKNAEDYPDHPEDPMWRVIAEGGPFHCRGYLDEYCQRLEDTNRGWAAKELRQRHPNEH